MNETINKDLGLVTAYAYAIEGGYTGTEEEFTEMLGNIAIDLSKIENLSVTVTTLPAGSQATASLNGSVLSLGIPRGDKGDKGNTGETGAPAGFGTVSATVDANIGTPSVEVTASGSDTAKNFAFAFHNLKGQKGDKGDTGEVSEAELAEVLEDYAKTDGYYPDMAVGTSDQLTSTESIEDTELYTFRASGGGIDIGNRETDKLVGGTVAWNQLTQNGNFADASGWESVKQSGTATGTLSVSGGVMSVEATTTGVGQGIVRDFGAAFESGHVYINSLYAKADTAGHNLSTALNGQTVTSNRMISGQSLTTSFAFYAGITKFTPVAQYDVDRYLRISISSSTSMPIGEKLYIKEVQLIDLTQMFGSTIADALYEMEQAESGSGVAWFKKYFPKPYYAYDAGSLQSVNVASHDMTGFNQWDEVWESGAINGGNGQNNVNAAKIRSKNYISVLPNTAYYFQHPTVSVGDADIFMYDADKNYLGYVNYGVFEPKQITTPQNAYYMRFSILGTTYNNDICINRVWTGNRNGEYEPYELHSYAYDESVELRGIPSLVDGELVYDGDTYEADGTVNRKYGIVDLGSLSWVADSNRTGVFYANVSGKQQGQSDVSLKYMNGVMSSKYAYRNDTVTTSEDKYISDYPSYSGTAIFVRDTAYSTASDFKTAMDGVYLIYKLATPTSEQATGFTNPQVVDAFGTEEYVDAGVKSGTRDVSIPVGHVTQYMANLRDKLQHLPNLAKEDGDYFVNQTGTQMRLKKVEGYYEDLISGMADNLTTKIRENDQTPYLFRTSGGSVDIGDREYINGIVGGTVAFNQQVSIASIPATQTVSGVTFTNNTDGTVTVSGTATEFTHPKIGPEKSWQAHKYAVFGCPAGGSKTTYALAMRGAGADTWDLGNGAIWNAAGNTWKAICAYVQSGVTVNNLVFKPQIFDLTLMFGSTIADYIYSLEQANDGAGVAWFKSLFPKPYYAYNAGELMSVKGLVSHDMTGFNAWDEEWEVGNYDATNGQKVTGGTGIRSKNYIAIVPNTSYCFHIGSTDVYVTLTYYDADKNFISGVSGASGGIHKNSVFTTPSNARYMNFSLPSYGTTYNHDICINLSWDGSRDGEYEPYQKWSYPLDSDLELRGIPKLDASNNLYYDGDTYESDGTVTRKYGIVDLGTLNWGYSGGTDVRFYSTGLINAKAVPSATVPNMMCGKLRAIKFEDFYANTTVDKTISYYTTGNYLFVRDLSTTNPATFKASVSGVYLVYELATPTTETADPYTSPQIVNDFGTEEFVIDDTIDVPIPVGNNTDYPVDLKAKVEMAPNSPDGDGDYIVRQTNGENEYIAIANSSVIQNIIARLEALEQ